VTAAAHRPHGGQVDRRCRHQSASADFRVFFRSAASAIRARSIRCSSEVLRIQSMHFVRYPVGLNEEGKNLLAGFTC
jgi:hypothetical protein